MKTINYIYIVLIALMAAGCHKSVREGNISVVDVGSNASDTFPNAFTHSRAYEFTGEEHPEDFIRPLIDTLDITRYITDSRNADSIYSNLKRFYRLNKDNLFWYTREKPGRNTEILMQYLLDASDHGLDPRNYDVFKLANMQNSIYRNEEINPLQLAELDIRTSVSAVTFAWHLHNGSNVPVAEEGLWLKSTAESSVAEKLTEYDIKEAIDRLKPADPHYESTLQAVRKYEEIREQGGWERLPEGLILKIGDSSRHIPSLRHHLLLTGDLEGSSDNTLFDEGLHQAVMNFQERHGLEQDGIVGNNTLDALNVPVTTKLEVLRKNLERMRWMPADLGEKYILINIPEFLMRVYENNSEKMSMGVIVGTKKNKTPLFHDYLEYIVFNPSWTVPRSIVTDELLPNIRKDPDYLSARNYKVFDSWSEDAGELDPDDVDWFQMTADSVMIVQQPGDFNALGKVKFMMPNAQSIYLHDTPADHLFSESDRAFSHGCIRVEDPVRLGQFLLEENPEWDAQRIGELFRREEPDTVKMKEHIPVYITYRTAWKSADDKLQFRNDIYNFDFPDSGSNHIAKK